MFWAQIIEKTAAAPAPEKTERDRQVAEIRAFNRFHTVLVGALDRGVLASPFSLTEARVLYEIVHRGEVSAADLVRDLGLDPAYLSRIVRRFRTDGLVASFPSADDGRARILAATRIGWSALARLEAASSDEVAALLGPVSPERRRDLVAAMATIRDILDPAAQGGAPITLRPFRPGDIGWIVHRHAVLYSRDYGWDGTFEAFVAGIGKEFIENFDPERDACWVAERHGRVAGSATVVNGGDGMAKLRLLYVEPSARGFGIGRRLVAECIAFAKEKGYRKLTLWTNDILVSARRIYEAAGFRLVSEERHRSFGKDLVGQYWGLDL